MAKTNENVTFKGNPVKVEGASVKEGDALPDFTLTGGDLEDVAPYLFKGKVLVISVVPSLDTPVCSEQTKRFNNEASGLSKDVVILTVSMDLPFAQKRFCSANSIDRVVVASDYKYREFGEKFGVLIPDLGLLCRAVFVAGKDGRIKHAEYTDEITSEPDYDAVLNAVKASV